jgi:hypothetical protein
MRVNICPERGRDKYNSSEDRKIMFEDWEKESLEAAGVRRYFFLK